MCVFLSPAETTVPSGNFCRLCWKGEAGVREQLSGGWRPGRRSRGRERPEAELGPDLDSSQSHPPPHLEPLSLCSCCSFHLEHVPPPPLPKHALLLDLPQDSFLCCTKIQDSGQAPLLWEALPEWIRSPSSPRHTTECWGWLLRFPSLAPSTWGCTQGCLAAYSV